MSRREHGGRRRRGWKKRHLGVGRAGVILAPTLTEATGDDATTGIGLIEAVDGDLALVTADAADDPGAVHDAATAQDHRRGAPDDGGDGVWPQPAGECTRSDEQVATLGRRK